MDFKNVKNVEQYAAAFGRVGKVEISPVDFYEAVGVPEELRATFIVRPYNPIYADELKEINKAARALAQKELDAEGYNVFSLSQMLTGISALFEEVATEGAVEEACNSKAAKLVKDAYGICNETNGLKKDIDGWKAEFDEAAGDSKTKDYAVLSLVQNHLKVVNERNHDRYIAHRDLRKVYTLMVDHIDEVINLHRFEGTEFSEYSGDVDMHVLYSMPREILNWLDTEMQKQSSLSEREIVGL